MSEKAKPSLINISFEDPAPDEAVYGRGRDRNLLAIHAYVIDGRFLQRDELDDMFENPEVLSSQMGALEGWINAVEAGEAGVWAETGAAYRFKFMRIVLGWSVELGYGSADFHADRTAGNGYAGMPACTSGHLGIPEEV